jgi:hypothetical protein
MKRLYSLRFGKDDLEAAIAALNAHLMYKRGNEPVSAEVKRKLSASNFTTPLKVLLCDFEITAILNGIAILDATSQINLYGPNGSPGEKFKMLQGELMREIGERK